MEAFAVLDFCLLWGQVKVREEIKKSLLEMFATL